jgi:hypothetical protein
MIISTVVTTAHLISSFGLGAGGRWALQMDTSCHDTHFHWEDTDCIIQSMNFPAPHVDGIPGHSWHGNLF